MAAISNTFTWGTGRRKSSVARVRIKEGKGAYFINERPVNEYFLTTFDRSSCTRPLDVAELKGKIDVHVNVHGGGTTGQAGAIMQGLARAIAKYHKGAAKTESETAAAEAVPLMKKLRDSGFLTRDARMKERKKYGRRGARRSFQFSKR